MSRADKTRRPSTLRQLAREYFEGSLDREQYVIRRHQAISALQQEPGTAAQRSSDRQETERFRQADAPNEFRSEEPSTSKADREVSAAHPGEDDTTTDSPHAKQPVRGAIPEHRPPPVSGVSNGEQLQNTGSNGRVSPWRRGALALIALLFVLYILYTYVI